MPYELHLQFLFYFSCCGVLSVVCVCERECCKCRDNECKMRDGASFPCCVYTTNNNRNRRMCSRKGKGREQGRVCVATYQKQFQLVSIARHQPQPLAIALLSPLPLCLADSAACLLVCLSVLLLHWATLFSSPHTRHKSMFDFPTTTAAEGKFAKQCEKKKQNEREVKRQRGETGKDTGYGTRDTGDGRQDAGHYVRAMFKISASCLCFIFIFILYTLFFCFCLFLRCFSSHALHIFLLLLLLLFPCGK